jgi:hypothetical protein
MTFSTIEQSSMRNFCPQTPPGKNGKTLRLGGIVGKLGGSHLNLSALELHLTIHFRLACAEMETDGDAIDRSEGAPDETQNDSRETVEES